MLGEHGADGVSLRGIAGRVGIAPNAVYTYFPDKAAVVRGLVELLLGRVNHDRFTDRTLPWRDRIRTFALELRGELLTHPGSVHLLLASSLTGPNATAVSDTLLGILADTGLDPAAAARASQLLNVHILGSVARETAGDARPVPAVTDPEQFLWGIDRLLDGLAAYATT
jgi:AcrR family transcriptional regulator